MGLVQDGRSLGSGPIVAAAFPATAVGRGGTGTFGACARLLVPSPLVLTVGRRFLLHGIPIGGVHGQRSSIACSPGL